MAFKMKSPYPKNVHEDVREKFLKSKKKKGTAEETNPKYWEGKKSPHENL
jgi:hypothetical protein